ARRDDEGTPAGGRRDGASSGAGCKEKRDGWRVPAPLVAGIRLAVDHRPARRSCWRRMPFDDPRRPNTWMPLEGKVESCWTSRCFLKEKSPWQTCNHFRRQQK
ncbi:unnamed protein product, partial [Musa acuminata var. zebrina]